MFDKSFDLGVIPFTSITRTMNVTFVIRFLRSRRKREKFINAIQLLLAFPEDKELQASLGAARKETE